MAAAVLSLEGQVVCATCSVADTAFARMKGLLGRRSLSAGEGLLLRPAGSVHTAFMRFPIDVVFLDRELEVLQVSREVRPWRVAAKRGAKAVLELPAGECERQGISPGLRMSAAEIPARAAPADRPRGVPIAVACVLAALALARFGAGGYGVVAALFAAVLGVLSMIDLERRLIPNRIVLPAAGVMLAAQTALLPDRALEWLLAALGAAGLLLVLALIRPGGLGMGDVKLGLLLGAGLGHHVA